MADLSSLKGTKKKNRFGDVGQVAEPSKTLAQPEHAPADDAPLATRKARNKTGRTVPFGTKVSAEFLADFKRTAFEDGLKLVDLLEQSLEAYKKQKR